MAVQQYGTFIPARDLPAVRDERSLLTRALGIHSVLAVAVATLVLAMIPLSMADPDIWWHLRNAQEMVVRHAFVRHDAYSFTVPGVPWIDHEWLAELPFYMGWRIAGPTGIYLLTVTLITSIFLAVQWLCWKSSRNAVSSCIATLIAALLATVSFGPRTLLFGWLCFVLQQVLLERFRQHPKAILLLPLLYLFWVNLHGSWLIGTGVLSIVVAAGHLHLRRDWLSADRFSRQQSRMLLCAGLGILPALFCNPWGWRLVGYPFNFAYRQTLNVASIEEWRSLDLHSMRGYVLVIVIALLVAKQLWRPRAWSVSEVVLFSSALYGAMTHERFLFLLALVAAPIAARSFQGDGSRQRLAGRVWLNATLLLVLTCAAASQLRRFDVTHLAAPGRFPSQGMMNALDHLQSGTRLFHEYGWGGYLEWYRPRQLVFIDSSVDIFEYNEVLRDYLDVIRIRKTISLLDKYGIDAVAFEEDTPLVYFLRNTGNWHVAYEDGHSVLLQRAASLH